jgi:ribose/xylose/arabinose/galactoside ABC-type transport system permease subunit
VAVGFDRDAAHLAGIDVRRVRMRAFLVASALVYVSTMLYMISYQGGGWTAATGTGLELTAIAAAVIGGTAITGGRFNPVGVAMGIGVWAALGHVCIMAQFLDPEHQKLAGGALLLLVAFLDSKRTSANGKKKSCRDSVGVPS